MRIAIVLFLLVIAGCSEPVSSEPPGGGGTTPPEIVVTDEPAPEPTEPESTQPEEKKPGFGLATAPVGGNAENAGVEQCASVSPTGVEFREGTTMELGPVHLEPDGVFQLDDGVCKDRPSCANVRWSAGSTDTCYVGARQVANGTEAVKVVIPAQVTCATEQDCTEFETAAGKGSFVFFVPGELTSGG